jgi:hypothetical protein
MNKKGETKTILAISLLILSITIGLLITNTQLVSADTGHRKKVPPEEPDCPKGFVDFLGDAHGKADDNSIDIALGAALQKCDADRLRLEISQYQEFLAAKQKCEAVEGCQLSYELDDEACNASKWHDCVPVANPFRDSFAGPWRCWASGMFDYKDYSCSRDV